MVLTGHIIVTIIVTIIIIFFSLAHLHRILSFQAFSRFRCYRSIVLLRGAGGGGFFVITSTAYAFMFLKALAYPAALYYGILVSSCNTLVF